MTTGTRTQTDREFVISYVDIMIPVEQRKLTGHQEWRLYCMADGFGKRTPAELRQINGGYDWSHFRDSSDEAFREMAYLIRCWLGRDTVEANRLAAAAARSEAFRHLQTAQTLFLDNPSAENFIIAQKAMLRYQEIIYPDGLKRRPADFDTRAEAETMLAAATAQARPGERFEVWLLDRRRPPAPKPVWELELEMEERMDRAGYDFLTRARLRKANAEAVQKPPAPKPLPPGVMDLLRGATAAERERALACYR